jgi:hypothetical protein
VVEGIDVGRTTCQEQVNHALGPGGKMGLPRRQRGVAVAGRGFCVSERIPKDTCQGKRTHSHATTAKQIPAGQKAVFPSCLVTVHRFLHRFRELREQLSNLPGEDLAICPGSLACLDGAFSSALKNQPACLFIPEKDRPVSRFQDFFR